jgi:N-methylhydantoinase B
VADDALDPITFEVLRNALIGLVDEMGDTLQKAGFSLLVNEGRDLSASICNARGDLIAEGEDDLPDHVGTIPFSVRGMLDWIGRDQLHEGDLIIMNDPFIGGTHCQDVRTLMPVFWDGELIAFVTNSVHWSDVGGPIPGSFNAGANSVYQEGLCITPTHLVREGRVDDDVLRLILRNIRVADLTRGDIMAQVEACRTGEERLHLLCEKYGRTLILEEMDALLDYAERLMRAEWARIPDGVYSWSDFIDRDPGSADDDPLEVRLELAVDGDRAILDLSGSAPQARGAVNAPLSLTVSACVVSIRSVFPHIPANEGMNRTLEFRIPEGLVVNAVHPAPISGAFATIFEKVAACTYGCFSQIVPDRVMACPGNIENFITAGVDPRPGFESDYILYLWTEGGQGGRPGKKDNHSSTPIFASGSKNVPMEAHERALPVLFHRYEFIPDSEGAGRHRGGWGIAREFSLTAGEGRGAVIGDRGRNGAWGLDGGRRAITNAIVYAPGTAEQLAIGMQRTGVRIEKDRLIQIREGGGGGWGAPFERPQEWVLDDVIDGLLSLERAADVYGVVIAAVDEEALDYRVDPDATRSRREQLSQAATAEEAVA